MRILTQGRGPSRRLLLGGAGATLALPFLESLRPRRASAADPPPKRFLGYYVPNGIRMEHWTPAKTGPGYVPPPILQPLAALQSEFLVLTGLANRPAKPDGPGDHASGTGAFLTCAHPFKTEGENIRNGISLDQRLAEALAAASPLPSLQLGIEGGSSAGGCDSGYSCAYSRNISWASEKTPLPKLTSPRVVFDRLFAGLDEQASQADIERRARHNKSLLDYVAADATALSGKLGRSDRLKLDEYLTGIRKLETRLAGPSGAQSCKSGARPSERQMDFPQHLLAMHELIVVAFQCNLTRLGTFMLGNAGSGRNYAFIGASGGHHEISHHQMDPQKLDKLTKIATWEVEQFASLLGKLKAVDEGGTSLLDNTCIFFSSEIEDGNTHSHFNMPIILAGKAGGSFRTGQNLVFGDKPSVGSLFLSILHAFGVPDGRFGDADKPLPGLT